MRSFQPTRDTCVNSVDKKLLLILAVQGITFRLGESHAIQFRLIAEVRDVENMNVVLEETINRGGERAFQNYWGRWLNQHSQRSDPPAPAKDNMP